MAKRLIKIEITMLETNVNARYRCKLIAYGNSLNPIVASK
jgi:hypothetical protein